MDSLSEMHRQLLEEGLTGGVEIVNGSTFYEEALQLANQSPYGLGATGSPAESRWTNAMWAAWRRDYPVGST